MLVKSPRPGPPWGMRPGGFEPPTNSLEGCCSIHLSYGRANNLRTFAARAVCRSNGTRGTCGKHSAPLGERQGLQGVLDDGGAVAHRPQVPVHAAYQGVAAVP